MVVNSQEPTCQNEAGRHPLLMEQHDRHQNRVQSCEGGRPSSTDQVRLSQSSFSSSSRSNSLGPSVTTRRLNELGRQWWNPFNFSLWFLVEFVIATSQIIASVVVLYLSRNEKPQAPLFAWIVGYAAGSASNLSVFYWRSVNHHQISGQSSTQSSVDRQNTYTEASSNAQPGAPYARLNVPMDQLKMALDSFFVVWFIIGNVWIFGGHASASEAPYLYRFCIVLLTISCIGYALPFILCALMCCCLPCVIPFLGHGDLNQRRQRGANVRYINTLPAYKFKLKRIDSGSSGGDSGCEGGIVAAGTERERGISEEDAVCCICLVRYGDNDALRELPCSHFFHMHCVDKWLKLHPTCPLCKFAAGNKTNRAPQSE